MYKSIDDICNKYTSLSCCNPHLQKVTDGIHELIKELTLRSNHNKTYVTDTEPIEDKANVNIYYMIYRLEDMIDIIKKEDDDYYLSLEEKIKEIDELKFELPKLNLKFPEHKPAEVEIGEMDFPEITFDDILEEPEHVEETKEND